MREKETRPVHGRLVLNEKEFAVDEAGSFAVLDHGRGKWPYSADLELVVRAQRAARCRYEYAGYSSRDRTPRLPERAGRLASQALPATHCR